MSLVNFLEIERLLFFIQKLRLQTLSIRYGTHVCYFRSHHFSCRLPSGISLIQRFRQTGRSLVLKPILFSTHVHGSWRFESFHRTVARHREKNTGKIGDGINEDPPVLPCGTQWHSSIKIGTALLCNPGVKARVVWWVDSEFLLWEILIVADPVAQPHGGHLSHEIACRFFRAYFPPPLNEWYLLFLEHSCATDNRYESLSLDYIKK